jgi:hypothetical protein
VLKSEKQHIMSDNLSRIIKFAQSTGDKLIITDPEGKEPVVIMPFEMYEHLINTGRKESNISEKRTKPATEASVPELDLPDFDDLALESSVEEPEIEPIEVTAPPTPKKTPIPKAKSPTLVKKEDDEEPPEEEQFYLEPVS